MLDEEYDKEYYIKCKKCKSIAEKIINNRTENHIQYARTAD